MSRSGDDRLASGWWMSILRCMHNMSVGLKDDDSDWYRSSRWDDSVATAFEAKLGRARARSRPQYVRIQGVHLIAQADAATRAAGRALLRRVIDEYGEDDALQSLWAAENLATALEEDDRADEAEALTRELIARRDSDPTGWRGGRTDLDLALAEMLLRRGDPDSLQEADERLDRSDDAIKGASMFRDLVLRQLVARARVAERRGDHTRAGYYADEALEVAAETTPSLPRHPDVGRPEATSQTIDELRQLSRNAG